MLNNLQVTSLLPYTFNQDMLIPPIKVIERPEYEFRINPDLEKIARDILVVFHRGEWYLVQSDISYQDLYKIPGLCKADIYEGVDIYKSNFLFISPYSLFSDTSALEEVSLELVNMARHDWILVKWPVDSEVDGDWDAVEDGCYIMFDDAEPEDIPNAPIWLGLSMTDLVLIAFGSRVINAGNIASEFIAPIN